MNNPVRTKLTLGERIHTARRRVGARLEDVAEELKVSRQLVSKWERGESVPDLIQVLKLAAYTDTPLEWFTEDLVADLREATSPCESPIWVYQPSLFAEQDQPHSRRVDEAFGLYAQAS